MVRFMIGQVDFQQLQAAVDGIGEAESAGEGVKQADAAAGDAASAPGDFVMDVARGHHGLGAATQVFLVQTPLDAALAVGQFSSYARFHSKSLRAIRVGQSRYFIQHRKSLGISSFSAFSSPESRGLRLVKV